MFTFNKTTAASKGNRILHILEAPADVGEASSVVGEGVVGGSVVGERVVGERVVGEAVVGGGGGVMGASTSVTGIKNPEDVARRLDVTVWLKAVTNVHSDSDFIITVRCSSFSISSFTPAIHVAEEPARRGLGDICEILTIKQ